MKKKYLHLFFILLLSLGISVWTSCGSTSSSDADNSEVSKEDENIDDENNKDIDEVDKKVAKMTGNFDHDIYVSKNGAFKVKFPEEPEVSMDIVETEAGGIELYTYMYEISNTEAYMVALGDYPAELIDAEDPYSMLVTAREGALEDMISIIEKDNRIEISGFPAIRTYAISQEDNMYIIYQAVLANNRLYQVMMAREADYSSAESVSSFLDSFEVTMKK